jgi:hypothetical protein
VGIETLGRTLYVWGRFRDNEAPLSDTIGPASNPLGDVDMLEMDERAEDASSRSVFIDEAIESRALSGFKWMLPPNADFE